MTERDEYLATMRRVFSAGWAAREARPTLDVDEAWEEWVAAERDLYDLSWLNLPVRLHNALWRMGVRDVRGAREWLTPGGHPDYPPGALAAYDLRNIGFKSVEQGCAALAEFDRAGRA